MRAAKRRKRQPVYQRRVTAKWVKYVVPKRFFPTWTEMHGPGASTNHIGSKESLAWLRRLGLPIAEAVSRHTRYCWVWATAA